MFLKSLRESAHIKNYYIFNMLLSSLFIIMGLTIPQYVIDFKYNGIMFMNVEYIFIFLSSIVFLSSLVMYLTSFFTKTFTINRTETSVKIKKNSFLVIVFFKCFFYITVSNYNYYKGLEPLFSNMVDSAYLCYIASIVLFILYFVVDCHQILTKKTPKHHWFEKYLDYKQNKKIKVIEQDGNIISIYFKGFKLNELSNSIFYKGHELRIHVFKSYLDEHNYTLNDLNDNDILMIKMIGI